MASKRRWLLAVLVAGATGCSTDQPVAATKSETMLVFVSIPPLVEVVERVAGERVRVESLVGAGQSPHTFTLTPGQVRRLSEAKAFFAIGVDYEIGVLPRIRSACPDIRIVETQREIPRRADPHAGAHHDGHHHGAGDPHIWLDPLNISTIATNVCAALIDLDPAGAADYPRRLAPYLEEVLATDDAIKRQLAPYAGKSLLVYHPAFGYFADRYGLHEVAIEADGKAPGSQRLSTVIDEARKGNMRTVFHAPDANMSLVNAVADELGGEAVLLDPLAPDLLANLRRLADAIVASFREPQ